MVQTSKRTGLQAMLQPGIHYDDLLICNSQGVYKNEGSLLDQINQQLNNHYAGLQNTIDAEGIKIYPNPASAVVNVKYLLSENELGILQLYNIVGNEVKKVELTARNNHVSFSVADLMTGVYIYKYSINGKLNTTGKLIIE